MKHAWQEEQSHGRGYKTFVLDKSPLRIAVLNGHLEYLGTWALRTNLPTIDLVPLQAKTEEEAKEEALLYMRMTLRAMLRSIGGCR